MAQDTKWSVHDNIWHFTVTDPHLHPKGFTIYKVICKAFPVRSPEMLTEVMCWKRYNDFKILHKSLLALHKALHRRDQFPEFAKPKLFGRFDENVIEERKLSALELLNFIATQPHLYKSLVFKQFLDDVRIQSDTSHGESLMTPRPSNLDIISCGLSNEVNPTSDTKVDVHQDSKNEKYTTSVGKHAQERKEQTAGLVCGNGTSQKRNTGLAPLEGTWNFPQVADNISLSSSIGDDTTDIDEEPILATSLPETDLAYFDPIGHDLDMVGIDGNSGNVPRSNSWLLDSLNICAVMGSEAVDNQDHGDIEGETVSTPVAADFTDNLNSKSIMINTWTTTTSSTWGKGSSDPSSPTNSSRKGSSGSGNATPGKSFDLEEFDPIRRMSQNSDSSKVECGKGDLDLSAEYQRPPSAASNISTGSHRSQSSSLKTVQAYVHPEYVNNSSSGASLRSQSVGSDKSQDSDKASSNKSTPMRTSRSLLKRIVSANPVSNKPRSATEQNMSADLNGKEDYIYLAASQISMAQNSEVNGDYEVAFAYYKSGVGILLQGVQGDINQSRRDAVRRKTAQYLMKAEDLFNRHLADENVDERRWGADSFLSPSLDLDPSFVFIRGTVKELRNFQVLGIIGKVVLVQDKVTDETFVIKSIPKSTPDVVRTHSILPTSCPHMVSLHKFYETDDSVFLLLQYASGGKLWTYIEDYLNSDRGNQTNGDINVNAVRTNVRNIYSGTKLEAAIKDENVQQSHTVNSSGSKLKSVLSKDLDSGSSENKLRSGDAIEGHVQSTETTGVIRFSTLKENGELHTVDESVKESSHIESFEAQDNELAEGSESRDIFNDSDLNDVLKYTHKKVSLSRRFSSFSDDCVPTNEGEISVVSPSTAQDDHFQSLLHENRGNLEAFSINSFDSEDTRHNSVSSFHEKLRSSSESASPPKHITTRQISADEVFTLTRREMLSINSEDKVRHVSADGVFSHNTASKFASIFNSDDLIRNSKELIKQVETVLTETYDRSGESDTKTSEEGSQGHSLINPSSCSSDNIAEEPSIYDVNQSSKCDTSNDSSDTNPPSVSNELCSTSADINLSTDSLSDENIRTDKDNLEMSNSKDSAVTEEAEYHILKTESELDSPKHQPTTVTANSTSSYFRQANTPRKLSLNRINSKDMTRSASFECDLKSPTRNRARVVSDLFERLDSTSLEQIRIPETSIRKWMAQLVTAVSRLHSLGIVCRDLKPSNVLLGDGGQVYLSYFCSLGHGDAELDWDAVEDLYAAPEVGSVSGYDKSCDWWSIGALLYELIVGRSLIECHPGGINSHTCLHVPTFVSNEARGLLEGLLHYNPNERLGSRMAGSEEIKAHPFFAGVDWHTLEYS